MNWFNLFNIASTHNFKASLLITLSVHSISESRFIDSCVNCIFIPYSNSAYFQKIAIVVSIVEIKELLILIIVHAVQLFIILGKQYSTHIYRYCMIEGKYDWNNYCTFSKIGRIWKRNKDTLYAWICETVFTNWIYW